MDAHEYLDTLEVNRGLAVEYADMQKGLRT